MVGAPSTHPRVAFSIVGIFSGWSMSLFTSLSHIILNVFIRCTKTVKSKRKELQRKPGKIFCKRAEITMPQGKCQVDVIATQIQRKRASCRTAGELEVLEQMSPQEWRTLV